MLLKDFDLVYKLCIYVIIIMIIRAIFIQGNFVNTMSIVIYKSTV